MQTLHPPIGAAPFRKFRLWPDGRTIEPDFSRGGSVLVDEIEAVALEAEGWTRQAGKAALDDLRKRAQLDASRAGIKLKDFIPMREKNIRAAAAFCAARHQRGGTDGRPLKKSLASVSCDR